MIEKSIKIITETIFRYYGGKQYENLKCRKQQYIEPRQIAMYLIREIVRLNDKKITFQFIADKFNKDHTTVLSACNTIKNRIETNKEFRSKIKYLENLVLRRLEMNGLIISEDSEELLNFLLKEREEIDSAIERIVNQKVVEFKNVG